MVHHTWPCRRPHAHPFFFGCPGLVTSLTAQLKKSDHERDTAKTQASELIDKLAQAGLKVTQFEDSNRAIRVELVQANELRVEDQKRIAVRDSNTGFVLGWLTWSTASRNAGKGTY